MGYDLGRFLIAQRGVYDGVLDELRRGRKTGHWIWFIFPQLYGLGRSEMSRYYGVKSLDEARAYVADPARRSLGFGLSMAPILVLLAGALIGAVRAMLETSV